MTHPSTAPGTIRSLVGIRGVLSATVLGIHLAPTAAVLVPATAPAWIVLWHAGYPALDVFFVMSGFLITTGYGKRFASWPGAAVYGRFLVSRLSRFYPVHIVVLAALVTAVLVGSLIGVAVPRTGDGVDLLRETLLVQGWGGSHGLTWNGPTWSLSAEWLCYLAFPALAVLLTRVRRPAALVAVYLTACAVPLTAYSLLGFDDAAITYRAPLFRAVGCFVAGAALCLLGRTDSPIPAFAGRFVGPIAAASVLGAVGLYEAGLPPILIVPLAALIVPGLAQQRGWLDAVLSSRPLMLAGEASVALYITHLPWLLLASAVITPARFPGAWGVLGVALYLVGAAAVAAATLVAVERPGQRLLRRWTRARTSTVPTTVHAPPVSVR